MEINNLELSDAKEYNSEVEKERMEKFGYISKQKTKKDGAHKYSISKV